MEPRISMAWPPVSERVSHAHDDHIYKLADRQTDNSTEVGLSETGSARTNDSAEVGPSETSSARTDDSAEVGLSEMSSARTDDSAEVGQSEMSSARTDDSAEVGPSEMSSARTEQATISSSPLISSMSLNDNKAGMEGLDKDRINKIIHDASKGSKFYENERRKEEVLNFKIKQQRSLAESITASQLQIGCHQADQLLRDLEDRRDLSRTIVHVDMDAFYAAVEMRDDPSLREKPMAVGSLSMLSTSNYVARRFGIRAAMPGFIGRKLCPELVIVPLNFDKYIAVSETVKHVLAAYDPNFTTISLDEAYLDFTEHLRERVNSPLSSRTFLLRTRCSGGFSTLCMCDLNLVLRPLLLQEVGLSEDKVKVVEDVVDGNKLLSHSLETEHFKTCSVCQKPFPTFTLKAYGVTAEEAVLEMRNRIEQRTHLTASAGIAPNTMLAKICSDKNKPNGQFLIEPIKEQVEQFISGLPVRKIPGIGKVTEKLLEALGINTCQDLHKHRALLYHVFSPTSFHYFMNIALGIGSSTLERGGERKSISTEQTFRELAQPRDLLKKCQELCQLLSTDLKREQCLGKTVTLKIKTVGFEVKTRAHTLSHHCNDERTIFSAAKQLLETEIQSVQPQCLRLRLMGVRMSKLVSENDSPSNVTSFFEKQGRNASTCRNLATACSPAEETNSSDSRDASAASCSSLYSSIPFNSSCFLQLADDDDGEDFQECIDNNKVQEMPHLNKPSTGITAIGASQTQQQNSNNKMNKQETIVHFLCRRQNSSMLGENNCNCVQCRLSKHRDVGITYAASKGSVNVSQTSHVAKDVHKISVDIDDVNKTPLSIGYVNNAPIDNQTANQTHVRGVSSVGATPRCAGFSSAAVRFLTSPGHHNQLQTSPPAPCGAQTSKPSNSEATESSQSGGMIHCPVCGQQKYQWPLEQLNAHIDLCLSRSTVREMLTDQQENRQVDQHYLLARKRARPAQTIDPKFDKRTKIQHTLLTFFKP